jgi:hypothetical protein
MQRAHPIVPRPPAASMIGFSAGYGVGVPNPHSPSPRVSEPAAPSTPRVPRKSRVDIAAVRLAMRRTGGRLKLAAAPRVRERA